MHSTTDLAKAQSMGQTVIHCKHGQIQTNLTYRKDPPPPKGYKVRRLLKGGNMTSSTGPGGRGFVGLGQARNSPWLTLSAGTFARRLLSSEAVASSPPLLT